MRRIAQFCWRVLLPLLVVVAIGRMFYLKLSEPELWSGVVTFRFEWLIPAALLYLAAHTMWSGYYVVLLRNQGATTTATTGIRAYFVSQLGKYVPGKVWVIIIRIRMLGNIGISRTAVGITATYESLTAMAAGAAVGAFLLPPSLWEGLRTALAKKDIVLPDLHRHWLILPMALAPIGLVGLNRFVNRVNRWRKGPNAPQLPRVKLHMVLLGLAWDSLGWLVLGLSLWMTVKGMHQGDVPITTEQYVNLVSINAIAYILGFVAVFMPAGAGVRELALQILLALELQQIMPPDSAGAVTALVAIVLRLLWTVAELMAAGLLYACATKEAPVFAPVTIAENPNG